MVRNFILPTSLLSILSPILHQDSPSDAALDFSLQIDYLALIVLSVSGLRMIAKQLMVAKNPTIFTLRNSNLSETSGHRRTVLLKIHQTGL